MSNVRNYMSPEEINVYQTRRQQADTAYGRSRANIDYSRSIAGVDYGLAKSRGTRSWDKAYKGLPSNYARRGILRSGIYNKGYKDYLTSRENAETDLTMGNRRQMDQYERQNADLELVRNMTQQQIEAERLAAEASLASRLRGL
jgi:hypothetical protein